jgi:dienelactone hydrolase
MGDDGRSSARGTALAGAMLAMAMLPSAARAQETERGAFVLLAGRDTIAVERFSRGPARLEGDLSVRPSVRVAWTAALAPDGAVTRFEARTWTAAAAEGAPPAQTAMLEVRGDSAFTVAEGGGERQEARAAVTAGFVPFVNPSALLMEQILVQARRGGARDSVSVPVLPVGAPAQVTSTVRWIGPDSATLTLGPALVRARVNAAGRLLGAAVPSQNLTIVRTGELPAAAALRADYSAPAGAPYTAEDVTVPTPGGFTLAGTLTLPKERRGRVPAVVTITGSGQQDRDESLSILTGYRPFRQVADTLGRRGIAVLRLDDRGFGASGGRADSATTADFADDVRAAVAFLRARPEIDPDRIALLGHSEGGVIAPMVAVSDPRVRAVVLVAGTARTGRRVIDYQLRSAVEHDTAVAPEKRDSAFAAARAAADAEFGKIPWFPWFLAYDPLPTARGVRQPVLIVQGANDRQVTADQAEELGAALRQGGNRDVTVRVFPDANHLLVRDPDGTPAGYASLPSRQVLPEILGTIADWLAAKLR